MEVSKRTIGGIIVIITILTAGINLTSVDFKTMFDAEKAINPDMRYLIVDNLIYSKRSGNVNILTPFNSSYVRWQVDKTALTKFYIVNLSIAKSSIDVFYYKTYGTDEWVKLRAKTNRKLSIVENEIDRTVTVTKRTDYYSSASYSGYGGTLVEDWILPYTTDSEAKYNIKFVPASNRMNTQHYIVWNITGVNKKLITTLDNSINFGDFGISWNDAKDKVNKTAETRSSVSITFLPQIGEQVIDPIITIGQIQIEYDLISNTNKCTARCSQVIEFSINKNKILESSNLSKSFKISQGKDLLSSGYNSITTVNKTYSVVDVIKYNCINQTISYPNGTQIIKEICDTKNVTSETNYTLNVSKPIQFPVSLTAGKKYKLELWGEKKPALGNNSIDAVISILGFNLTPFAWWNSSVSFAMEIIPTITGISDVTNNTLPVNGTNGLTVGGSSRFNLWCNFPVINTTERYWLYYTDASDVQVSNYSNNTRLGCRTEYGDSGNFTSVNPFDGSYKDATFMRKSGNAVASEITGRTCSAVTGTPAQVEQHPNLIGFSVNQTNANKAFRCSDTADYNVTGSSFYARAVVRYTNVGAHGNGMSMINKWTANDNYWIRPSGNSPIASIIRIAGVSITVEAVSIPNNNELYDIIAAYDGITSRLYVNSVLNGTPASFATARALPSTTGVACIGMDVLDGSACNTANYFAGYIDYIETNEGRNLSSDMAKVLYNSYAIPSFWVFGQQESEPAPPSVTPTVELVSPSPINVTIGRNYAYINATVGNMDTCLLEWNGVNETMNEDNATICAVNKTSLSDANYTYGVWVNSSTNTFAFTGHQWVKTDTTSPAIVFQNPTPNNETLGSNVNWIAVNISTHADSDIGRLEFNGTNYTMTKINATFYFLNLTNLADFNYSFAVWVNDSVNNYARSAQRWAIVSVSPTITFTNPTPNNETAGRAFYYVNVSVSNNTNTAVLEVNGANITMTQENITQWSINRTSQADGNYTFAVWANNSFNTSGRSATRWVYLIVRINASIDQPQNITYNITPSLNYRTGYNTPDQCWYQLGTNANITIPSCGNVTLLPYERTTGASIYHFNNESGNQTIKDSGTSASNAEPQGTGFGHANYTGSRLGQASLTFGGGRYYKASDHVDQRGMTALTIEAWIYLYDNTSEQYIVSKWGVDTAVDDFYTLRVTDEAKILFVAASGAADKSAISNTKLARNTWYHVAGIYNTTHVEVWVNGTRENNNITAFGSINNAIGEALYIGWVQTTTSYFNGTIDELVINRTANRDFAYLREGLNEVRLYANNSAGAMNVTAMNFTLDTVSHLEYVLPTRNNDAKQAQSFIEINATFTDDHNVSGHIDFNRSLVGYWNMDDNNATHVDDNSSYSNVGELVGGTIYNSSGKYGIAASFDGSNDYINISYSASLNLTNAITISAWVYANDLSQIPTPDEPIVSKYGNTVATQNWRLYIEESDNKAYFFIANSTGQGAQPTTTALTAGQWYHITAKYDSSAARIYKNGVLEGTVSLGGSISSSSEQINIGRDASAAFFLNGAIDEVRIWNRNISDEEINYTMNSTMPFYRNFTSIPDGTYNYSVFVIDTEGNTAELALRNITLDTTVPIVTLVSPTDINVTAERGFTYINVSIREAGTAVDTCILEWNGVNETMTEENATICSKNKTGLVGGTNYTYRIRVNDSAGNINVPENVWFMVDGTAPTLILDRPVNITYYRPLANVPVNFRVSGSTDRCYYDLNDTRTALSSCLNFSLTGLVDGHHVFIMYANDTINNTNVTAVNFTILPSTASIALKLDGKEQNSYYELGTAAIINATVVAYTSFSIPSNVSSSGWTNEGYGYDGNFDTQQVATGSSTGILENYTFSQISGINYINITMKSSATSSDQLVLEIYNLTSDLWVLIFNITGSQAYPPASVYILNASLVPTFINATDSVMRLQVRPIGTTYQKTLSEIQVNVTHVVPNATVYLSINQTGYGDNYTFANGSVQYNYTTRSIKDTLFFNYTTTEFYGRNISFGGAGFADTYTGTNVSLLLKLNRRDIVHNFSFQPAGFFSQQDYSSPKELRVWFNKTLVFVLHGYMGGGPTTSGYLGYNHWPQNQTFQNVTNDTTEVAVNVTFATAGKFMKYININNFSTVNFSVYLRGFLFANNFTQPNPSFENPSAPEPDTGLFATNLIFVNITNDIQSMNKVTEANYTTANFSAAAYNTNWFTAGTRSIRLVAPSGTGFNGRDAQFLNAAGTGEKTNMTNARTLQFDYNLSSRSINDGNWKLLVMCGVWSAFTNGIPSGIPAGCTRPLYSLSFNASEQVGTAIVDVSAVNANAVLEFILYLDQPNHVTTVSNVSVSLDNILKINDTFDYPQNFSIDTGNDNTIEITIPVLNGTTGEGRYDLNKSAITKICSPTLNCTGFPIAFYSNTPGIIELSKWNVTQNISAFVINTALINQLLANSSDNVVNITINISSIGGKLEITNIVANYSGSDNVSIRADYYGGNENYSVSAPSPTWMLQQVFSRFNITYPPGVPFYFLAPPSNNATNVTPAGQTNNRPVFNFTSSAYDQPFNISIRLNNSLNSCLNVTFVNSSTRGSAVQITTSPYDYATNVGILGWSSLWSFADLNSCTFGAFTLPRFIFEPYCTLCHRGGG